MWRRLCQPPNRITGAWHKRLYIKKRRSSYGCRPKTPRSYRRRGRGRDRFCRSPCISLAPWPLRRPGTRSHRHPRSRLLSPRFDPSSFRSIPGLVLPLPGIGKSNVCIAPKRFYDGDSLNSFVIARARRQWRKRAGPSTPLAGDRNSPQTRRNDAPCPSLRATLADLAVPSHGQHRALPPSG